MRLETSGIRRDEQAFEFTFDGEKIRAFRGETFASALIAAGIYNLRRTRLGQDRGVFCGMGVCGECRVLVEGRSTRACMEPAQPGARIERHPPQIEPPPHAEQPAPPAFQELTADVLVIGAGPAGLNAARLSARAGLDVLVVDERRYAGGQYFKQPAADFDVNESALDDQYAEGRRLINDAQADGARFLTDTTVWGVVGDNRVAATGAGRNLSIRAGRIILSPGAYERALPIPGWTLPGVMTTGAAQTLIRAYQTAPGQRVLIAGNGPLNLQVAYELVRAGCDPVAVAELAPAPWRQRPSPSAAMSLTSPGLVLTGLRQLLSLKSRKIPLFYRHALIRLDGDTAVKEATLARIDESGRPVPGTERAFEVDSVAMNYGFLPQSELARALGCEFEYDDSSGTLRASRAVDGETSVPGIFIVGDGGGINGARVAAVQGELAAMAIIRDLKPAQRANSRLIRRRRRELARHYRFQDALWRMFEARYPGVDLSTDSTLLCRCEEIAKSQVDSELCGGMCSLASLKKATRIGMGYCQGRYCTPLVGARLAHLGNGQRLSADGFFAPRPPAKPVKIGEIAAPFGRPLQPTDINSTNGRSANRIT